MAMSNDWNTFLVQAAIRFLSGQNPYGAGFGNPPWTLLFLIPTIHVPIQLAMLFPAIVLLILSIYKRKPALIFLVGTSFPFIASSIYGNIDWMVMAGVAIGGPLGVILDTIKPQAGIFAIVSELSKKDKWKDRLKLLIPLIVLS